MRLANSNDPTTFDEWFQGSKVVNPDGSPLVVFHGTQQRFEEFKTPAWFSPEEFYADSFASEWSEEGERTKDSRVVAVYLAFKNPLYTSDWGMTEPSDKAKWVSEITEKGFDSVIFSSDGEVEFIALQPGQIMVTNHGLAPDNEYKNYAGTDEGRKFEGRPRPENSHLRFVPLSEWHEIGDGRFVRCTEGADPEDEEHHKAVVGDGARIRSNLKWTQIEMADPADVDVGKSLCDEYLKLNGAVLVDAVGRKKRPSPK